MGRRSWRRPNAGIRRGTGIVLRDVLPDVRVVVLSASSADEAEAAALGAGAAAFLTKSGAYDELIETILAVARARSV